jgi:hypothetical protein
VSEAQEAASNSTTSYACDRIHSIVSSGSGDRPNIVTNVFCTRRKSTGCVVSASAVPGSYPRKRTDRRQDLPYRAHNHQLAAYRICLSW